MKKEFFYVADNVPKSVIYQIKIDDIKKLSQYIIDNFDKKFNDYDIERYSDMLNSFFKNNQNNNYYEVYNILNKFDLGRTFLYNCILLIILENKNKEHGLDEVELNLYHKIKNSYDSKIKFSIEHYEELYKREIFK